MQAIASPGETLKGGTPAVIKGSAGTHAMAITMSDNGAVGSLPESLLKGNYAESSLSQSGNMRKFVFTKSTFQTFEGSKEIAANQCWLECDMAQASELTIYFGAPTGIEETPSTTQGDNTVIYDIAGKRLNSTQKGINIVDNKKSLVK